MVTTRRGVGSDFMESKMRSSRLGIILLVVTSILFASSCTFYSRIMSRKALVDGSEAYKGRKFALAEELFREAAARDPEGTTPEGRTAQLFLARTLHSIYIGDRKQTAKAEEAINEYHKAIKADVNDQNSYKAIASLYTELGKTDDWEKWVNERANNEAVAPQYRTEALISLTAKQNSCAAEITDTEATKKTVQVDGKDAFQFVKPASEEDFNRLKGCVAKGTELVDKAMALEPADVNNFIAADVSGLTDAQLSSNQSMLKIYESAQSYKVSLLVQAARLAEMEGNNEKRDQIRKQSEEGKERLEKLSTATAAYQAEIDKRKAAAEAAERNEQAEAANSANTQ